MEWCIPIQTFQTENVKLETITPGPKPIIPLSYKDDDITFPSLVFLLPALRLKSYDPPSGRLVLSLADSPQTLSKLLMLQEMLLSAIIANQHSWFKHPIPKTRAELKAGFQSMIQDNEMHLYCPNHINQLQGPNIYNEEWVRSAGLLSGKRIRVVLKLQGISFHIHPATGFWTGKFRLQHRITSVLMMKEATIEQVPLY